MKLPEHYTEDTENDISEEEQENLIEEQIKLEEEIISTLTVGWTVRHDTRR